MKPAQPNTGRAPGLGSDAPCPGGFITFIPFHGSPLQLQSFPQHCRHVGSPAVSAAPHHNSSPFSPHVQGTTSPLPPGSRCFPLTSFAPGSQVSSGKARTQIFYRWSNRLFANDSGLDPSPCSTLLRQVAEHKQRVVWGFAWGISSMWQVQAALQPQCEQHQGSTHNPRVSLSKGRGLQHPHAGRQGGVVAQAASVALSPATVPTCLFPHQSHSAAKCQTAQGKSLLKWPQMSL